MIRTFFIVDRFQVTTYPEKTLTNLLDGAVDVDGDTIAIRRINGVVPSNWPHSVPLIQGTALVAQSGAITFDDEGDTSGHPSSGSISAGSFTFTLWDGQDESAAYTASVALEHVAQASTAPAQPSSPLMSAETVDSFDVSVTADPDDGGDPIIKRVVSILPKAEFDTGNFSNAVYLNDFGQDETRTIDVGNYPAIGDDRIHVVRWKAVNSSADNGGHGAYSSPAIVTLPELDNDPVFLSQPSLGGSSFTEGDVLTLSLGTGMGDNSVTASIEYFRLGATSKLPELSGLDWDSSGEATGTIYFRTRLTDDVTGAFTLSSEIIAGLGVAGGTGVDTTSTWAGLRSLISGWALSGGIRQVPGLAPYTIELSGDHSGNINLSGLGRMSHPVTIVSPGPYTAVDASVKTAIQTGGQTGSDLVGLFNLTDTSNLTFLRLNITPGYSVDNPITLTRSDDITFQSCWLSGYRFNPTGTNNTNTNFVMQPYNCDNLVFRDCYITHSKAANIRYSDAGGSCNNAVVEGCVFDDVQHDAVKVHGPVPNFQFLRNWYPRRISHIGTSHTDYVQMSGGTSSGVKLWGNFGMKPRFTAGTPYVMQGFWLKNDGLGNSGALSLPNLEVDQNIIAAEGVQGIALNAPGSSVTSFTGNELVRAYTTDTAGGEFFPQFGGSLTGIDRCLDTPNSAGNGGLQGSNHLRIPFTNNTESDWNALAASGQYSGYPKDTVNSIAWLEPPNTAARTHWNTSASAGTVGAHQRKQEIFSGGVHPGNAGWPVDGPWTDGHNADGAVPSGHTGNYDIQGSAA